MSEHSHHSSDSFVVGDDHSVNTDKSESLNGRRKSDVARDAFKTGDIELMRRAHDEMKETHTEHHRNEGGQYVKSIIFGGLDGTITIFAIIASIVGGSAKSFTIDLVIALGFAKLVADATSMGTGDYLSDNAEIDYANKELERETWEFEQYPEGELEEMVGIYKEKGFSEKDARDILSRMMKYPKFFVDHMLVQELELMPPDEDMSPVRSGIVTWSAFIAFGCLPLFVYLGFHQSDNINPNDAFYACIALTVFMLGVLGCLQAFFGTGTYFKTAIKTIINGSIAAAVSFAIGYGLGEALETTHAGAE